MDGAGRRRAGGGKEVDFRVTRKPLKISILETKNGQGCVFKKSHSLVTGNV